MFLSGKKLLIYKLNKIKNFVLMTATALTATASLMFVLFEL
jgi:hypothetical protein